jgi:site-specific DNA-cytosine methylase
MPILKPRAVGSYIFAGGFTIGVRKHFRVLCHLEASNYGVEVARRNLKLPIYSRVEDWPLEELKGIDFVYGNPPCAIWSGNNPHSHVDWTADTRICCVENLFGLLDSLKPKVWAWESVPNAPKKGSSLVNSLIDKAAKMGYASTQLFHDAQYLGAAQTRKRWFLIFHKIRLVIEPPNFDRVISAVAKLKTVKPRGLPAYDSRRFNQLFDKWLPRIPPGARLRRFWESEICPPHKWKRKANGHVLGRVGLGHIRLKDTGPATATVGYAMVHPIEHRFLTLNEVQAIAGYPDDYDFGGKSPFAKELDLIGRGVCPPVGEWLARLVAESLKENIRVNKPYYQVIDFRRPNITGEMEVVDA